MKKSIGTKEIHFPTAVAAIGTYDLQEQPNMMAASWIGICSSRPPAVSVCVRKVTHTYAGLMDHRAFTVNIPSETYVQETDFFGVTSGANVNKMLQLGLTVDRSKVVNAPSIREFPLVLECQVRQVHAIGIHIQFIGEIKDIKADSSVLGPRGKLDMAKVAPVLFNPGGSRYYSLGEDLGRGFYIGKKLK